MEQSGNKYTHAESLVLHDEVVISQHQKIRNNPEQYTPAPDLP